MKIEKKSKLKLLFVSLVMMSCSYGFTSCSDDDDDDKKTEEPTLEEVKGNFSGKMTYEVPTYSAGEEGTVSVDAEARVDADSLYFDSFPIGSLVDLIASEEVASFIKLYLTANPVKYAMKYTGAFDGSAKEKISMTFTAKPLDVVIPISEENVQAIKVTVSVDEKGTYTLEGKKLKFAIKATNVEINGTALPDFETLGFDFDMTKK